MSRIFKSPFVNVGKPLEVVMDESDFIYRRRMMNSERSSDVNPNDPNDAASLIIENANMEANEIIERANAEAERIISSAQIDADKMRLSASDQGYNEGYNKGLIDGKMETEDLAQQALLIKQELEEERENLIRDLETKTIDLVLQSVRKIINCELKVNRDVIVGVVTNALSRIAAGEAVIRISEEDFCTVEENKHKIKAQCKDVSAIEIKEDLSLEKGECIIETNCGNVDAGINTQLEKFEETINEVMGNDENAKIS